MKIQQRIFDLFKISVCLFSLITTFYVVLDFTYFLSFSNERIKTESLSKDPWLKTSWALLVNMSLLSLFIVQHSLLAMNKIKEAFKACGLQMLYRNFYVITTSGILSVLMKHWKTTPDAILWEINLNYKPIFWLYFGIHLLAWLIIYSGNICTDITELLGIKQVYYSVLNLPDPNLRKSPELRRLNMHMRHPSFLAFALIFWLYPIMSLDRLQLAVILTSYMYLAWNTDDSDYHYHKYQYERKYFELDKLNKSN